MFRKGGGPPALLLIKRAVELRDDVDCVPNSRQAMSTEPAISAFADLTDMNDRQGLSNTADKSVIFDATFMIAMRDFGNCQ